MILLLFGWTLLLRLCSFASAVDAAKYRSKQIPSDHSPNDRLKNGGIQSDESASETQYREQIKDSGKDLQSYSAFHFAGLSKVFSLAQFSTNEVYRKAFSGAGL